MGLPIILERIRFKVIDRENDDEQDIIYYTRVLLDHKLENQSKIFFNEEDSVFDKINSNGQDISFPGYQKKLESGQIWQITENYSLDFKSSSTDRIAWLEFTTDNEPVEANAVEKDFVTANTVFTYEPDIIYRKSGQTTNMTIFTTNITSVFNGQKDFILLEGSRLLSPKIEKTISNTTMFGYNSSWLHPGYRFTLGKIPSNLHVPNLFDDQRKWGDCVGCHDTSKNLRITQINAISSRLGKHSILNAASPDKPFMSDSIDKACLACHTEGTEPNTHSPTYVTPRKCISCHVDQNGSAYGAKKVPDGHRSYTDCEPCHMPNSHVIIKPGLQFPEMKNNVSKNADKEGTINLTEVSNVSKTMESTRKVPGLDMAMLLISLTSGYFLVQKRRCK